MRWPYVPLLLTVITTFVVMCGADHVGAQTPAKKANPFTAFFGSFKKTSTKDRKESGQADLASNDRPGRLLPETPTVPNRNQPYEGAWYPSGAEMEMPKPLFSFPWSSKSGSSDQRDAYTQWNNEIESGTVVSKHKKSSWFSRSIKTDQEDNGLDQLAQLDYQHYLSKKYPGTLPPYLDKAMSSDAFKQGMQAESQGNFAQAATFYQEFIRTHKSETENGTLAAPYHRLAMMSWREQSYDKAELCFQYALRYARDDGVPAMVSDYSQYLIERGQAKQAEITLRNTLLHYPDNPQLQISLGHCLTYLDKPMEGLRHLSAALGEERAYEELAVLYTRRGEYFWAQQMDEKRQELLVQRLRTQQPSQANMRAKLIPLPNPASPSLVHQPAATAYSAAPHGAYGAVPASGGLPAERSSGPGKACIYAPQLSPPSSLQPHQAPYSK